MVKTILGSVALAIAAVLIYAAAEKG